MTLTTEQNNTLNEYQNNLLNFDNLKDTYNYYKTENVTLSKNANISNSNITTNYRKTYYEEQGISNLKYYYDVFFYIYVFVCIAIIISLFTSQTNFSKQTTIFFLIILLTYPYYSTSIFSYIMKIFNETTSLFPTNIYTKI
jgi:hypothetical protein